MNITDILMPVYNGEEFLAEQIESVLSQSEGGWRLFVCDDCSEDGSFSVAQSYAQRFPERICVCRNGSPTGSACANYMNMLRNSEAEYIMFCDQDDFWHEDKVKRTLKKIRELEKVFPDSPLLIHSDLAVADRELNVTSRSFMRFQGLNACMTGLNRLVCQNNITGCTVMINRRLADIIKDAPAENMLMHDWWAGLAAAAFGHIGFIDEPLITYRQHGGNSVGAVNNRSARGLVRVLSNASETRSRLDVTYRQARSFYEFYKDSLSEESRAVLEKYISIPEMGKISRVSALLKYGYLKQNFMAAAGQLIFC